MNEASLRVTLEEARRLFARHGAQMSADRQVSACLERYRNRIETMQQLMEDLGIPAACGKCAQEDHGSCCFEGIEDGYGPLLLLINLLMGCELPEAKEVRGSCFFVGERGCKLKARYYFCLHYLCPRLQAFLKPEQITKLHQVLGEELQAGWEAEMTLHRWTEGAAAVGPRQKTTLD